MRCTGTVFIRKHNIETHRANFLTLSEQKRRVLRAQTSTDRHFAHTTRYPTGPRIYNIAIAWFHDRRRVWGTRARTRLVRECGHSWHRTGIDVVAGESKPSTPEENEVTRCLQIVRKIEDKVADLALRGVGVKNEVKDCTKVARGDLCPLTVGVCDVWIPCGDGDQC